jgi:hypothetical protein
MLRSSISELGTLGIGIDIHLLPASQLITYNAQMLLLYTKTMPQTYTPWYQKNNKKRKKRFQLFSRIIKN